MFIAPRVEIQGARFSEVLCRAIPDEKDKRNGIEESSRYRRFSLWHGNRARLMRDDYHLRIARDIIRFADSELVSPLRNRKRALSAGTCVAFETKPDCLSNFAASAEWRPFIRAECAAVTIRLCCLFALERGIYGCRWCGVIFSHFGRGLWNQICFSGLQTIQCVSTCDIPWLESIELINW